MGNVPFFRAMRRSAGYSLAELLVVVSLLALIAAAAVPALTSDDELALDRAAREVADALRYARAEAIRRGTPYGVAANPYTDRIDIYRLDESVSPATPVYDVRHPLTKQLYRIDFGADAGAPDVAIVYFQFSGFAFPVTSIGFSANTGVPKYNDFGTIRLLENGYVTLSGDGLTRSIRVSPVTGRVTIQ
jgi:prepilin-type N-terminal cleavage/methylation domain-containing protein